MPDPDLTLAGRLAEQYRAAFLALRGTATFDEPLFPGTREVLEALTRRDIVMGVATGKNMNGLRMVLEHHRLMPYFTTLQTADLHPSKPHPAMLEAAMRETGCGPHETLLVGDTTFDIEMAVAAGATPIGVAWGNHDAAELIEAGAGRVLTRFEDLLEAPGLRT